MQVNRLELSFKPSKTKQRWCWSMNRSERGFLRGETLLTSDFIPAGAAALIRTFQIQSPELILLICGKFIITMFLWNSKACCFSDCSSIRPQSDLLLETGWMFIKTSSSNRAKNISWVILFNLNTVLCWFKLLVKVNFRNVYCIDQLTSTAYTVCTL